MPMLPWIAFLGMLLALPGAALARDDGRWADSQYKAWYAAQRNADGQFCCDQADGHAFYGDYHITADGGVELNDGGKHYVLPPSKILHGPNPTGHAVYWWVEYAGADRVNYCFSEGSGG